MRETFPYYGSSYFPLAGFSELVWSRIASRAVQLLHPVVVGLAWPYWRHIELRNTQPVTATHSQKIISEHL